MFVPDVLAARARAWLDDDPDPATRAELEGLLAQGAGEELAARFGGTLTFGTAGIRGSLGAGPMRMNQVAVRRTAAGLAARLLAEDGEGARRRGVVVGHDARHRSADFAADAAAVIAGAGVPALLLGPCPTPLLAFAVRHLGTVAGVMVTASHNPPADNGLKVYWGDGAQIVPPLDGQIAAAMADVERVRDLPLGVPTRLGDEVLDAYLDAVVAAAGVTGPARRPGLRLVHTALHGVGTRPLLALFERAGLAPPHVVAAQAEPDPTFPTVPFPNPEEPGALDMALAEATRVGAGAVLANDPDADRLGVAVREGDRWRVLTGDELGVLLGDHVLSRTEGDDRLVATTIVSSPLLGRLADEHGVECAVTLTGFKWLMRAAAERPDKRFVFGYEEALGYAIGDTVHDKDGLSAALGVALLLGELEAAGETVAGRLAAIYARHGLHASVQWSIRMDGLDGAARVATAVERLVASPPDSVAGQPVTAVDRPAADVIVLNLGRGARVIVRPSGTEPKLKCYLQVVLPAGETAAASAALADLRQGMAAALHLDPAP